MYHLEWRQTFVPRPKLTSKIIKLINSGIFYIHGRAVDHTPLMVLNFGSILSHIENKSMTANEFGALHNFYARYMI